MGRAAWTADGYDFNAVNLVSTSLAKHYNRSVSEISLSITLTLLFRSLGAAAFGMAADRYGRKWPLFIDLVVLCALQIATAYAGSFGAVSKSEPHPDIMDVLTNLPSNIVYWRTCSLRYLHGRHLGPRSSFVIGKYTHRRSRRLLRRYTARILTGIPHSRWHQSSGRHEHDSRIPLGFYRRIRTHGYGRCRHTVRAGVGTVPRPGA